MNRLPMSAAASGMIRALVARAGVPRDRILLTDVRSTDWQSLTLVGERHEIAFRVTAPDSARIVERICGGLEDAEFNISGQIIADVALIGEPQAEADGSTSVSIEALTVCE